MATEARLASLEQRLTLVENFVKERIDSHAERLSTLEGKADAKSEEKEDETANLARVPSDSEVRFKAHAILNKVDNAENKRLSSEDLKAKEENAKKEEEAVAAAAEQAKLKKEQKQANQ